MPSGSERTIELNLCRRFLAEHSGRDIRRIGERPAEAVARIGEHLHAEILGQPGAIATITRCLPLLVAGARRPLDTRGPRGAFLFCGPEGSGRGFMARVLAEALFGEGRCVEIHLDAANDPSARARLLGHGTGASLVAGELTEPFRQTPHAILVVHNADVSGGWITPLLRTILACGQLSDGQGRVVSFAEAVVIFMAQRAEHLPDELISYRLQPVFFDSLVPEFRSIAMRAIERTLLALDAGPCADVAEAAAATLALDDYGTAQQCVHAAEMAALRSFNQIASAF